MESDDNKREVSSKRREEILDIAAQIFAERGFKDATVREIGNRAGILSGSLYHHFQSKESMMEEILSVHLDSLYGRYDKAVSEPGLGAAEKLHALIRTAYDYMMQYPSHFLILHNEVRHLRATADYWHVQNAMSKIEHLWTAVILEGVREGIFSDAYDTRLIYRTIMGAILSAIRWMRPTGDLRAEDIAFQQASLYLNGLLASPREVTWQPNAELRDQYDGAQ